MALNKKNKQPWPTKKAMEQVYEKKLWGCNQTPFYSGNGSHDSEIIDTYINKVKLFLTSFKQPISVCDLGCGDFNIGKQLVEYSKEYIAIDIVSSLIDFNKNKFTNTNLEFQCLDISKDPLPKGDCVIVRQVLQHLSNKEVKNILKKLTNFKYLILTEHIPINNFIPNLDIISGQGIRLKKKSGLVITEVPFHFKVKKQKELCSVILNNKKEIISTILYEIY